MANLNKTSYPAVRTGQPLLQSRALALIAATGLNPLTAYGQPVEVPENESELEMIEVTATQDKSKTAESQPGTQSVIDSATIEQRMVRNIKDLIRYEPGVNVGNDPQRFGASGFTIRGLGGNRVMMQIDGMRLPDAFRIGSFASATRNAVDMDALKAVEIVRGAGSAAQGGDAMGGSINFVTKDPADYLKQFGNDYYTGLKLNYNTTDNGFVQTATLAGALGNWESMLLFTHNQSNETDNKGTDDSLGGSRTTPSPQDNRSYNALAKVLYRFNDDNILRLTGEWLQTQSDLDALFARGTDISLRNVNSMLTTDDQRRWRVTVDHTLKNLNFALFDDAMWQFYTQKTATGQFTAQDRTSRVDGNTLTRREFDYDNDDFGGELKLNRHFEWGDSRHTLQYGGQISKNSITQLRDGSIECVSGSFNSLGQPTARCPKGTISKHLTPDDLPVRDFPLTTVTKAGAYLEDRIELFERRLELIPGGRWEYFRLRPTSDHLFDKGWQAAVNEGADPITPIIIDANAFLPRFGALWNLNDAFTVHGRYSHGFRGPNFSESNLGFTNFNGGYSNLPNYNIQPETSVGAEVGLRGQGEAGEFDVTLFRNDYRNFIYNALICNPSTGAACPPLGFLTYQTVNSSDPIRIQGIELKSRLHLDTFAPSLLGASLLFSWSYAEGVNLTDGRTNDEALRAISPMKAVVGLRYDEPGEQWGTEANLTLVAAKKASTAPEDAEFLPSGYGVVDINAYYNVNRHISLNLGVFNLFDKKYIDWEDINTRAGDPHTSLGNFAASEYWADRFSRPGRNLGVTLKIAY